MLAAVAYTWPEKKQQRRSAHAMSAKSSGSQSGLDAHVKLGWQKANQQAASLPASHLQFCAQLGVDVRLVLMLGAFLTPTEFVDRADAVGTDLLVEVWMMVMDVWEPGSARNVWSKKSAAQQQLELQLQLLLPGVFLHCAARMPATSRPHSNNCLAAAQLSNCGMSAWSSLTKAWPGNTAPPSGSGQQQAPVVQPQRSGMLQAAWVAEILPAALKLAQRVLPQLQDDADMMAGSAAAETGTPHLVQAAITTKGGQLCEVMAHYPAECLGKLLEFLWHVSNAVAPPGCLEQQADGLGHELSDAAASCSAGAQPLAPTTTSSQPSTPQAGSCSTSSPTTGSRNPHVYPIPPQPDGVATLASQSTGILKVLEGFLRTAASPVVSASRRADQQPFENNMVFMFLGHKGIPLSQSSYISEGVHFKRLD
jgi:hypothetical protein